MDAEEQKRWEEFDERMRIAEKRMMLAGNLIHVGIPQLVDVQTRINALVDSDARLCGRMEQFADRLEQLGERQKKTDEQIGELVESQKKTEQSLRAFIDSMNRGGNGSR